MDLKLRKAILNTLPKFNLGFTPPSMDDLTSSAGSFNLPGLTQGVTTAAGAFKADTIAKNNAFSGDLIKPGEYVSKAAGGGAGQFLKNNAGGIMNIASSGIDFISTLGDISKNKISSDEMMGSGGTSNESVNGISYQESKVDSAGYLNKIDATAKAGTMAAMGKGAALGGAVGSVIPGLGTVAGGVIGGVVGGIAGLFGSRKAKREAERLKRIALARTDASNTQNRETAYTIGLRNEFNRENRTDTSQSLFHAKEGKEGKVNPATGETYNDYIVNTAFGKVKAPQNAWVSAGEVIRSADGSLYRVPQTNRSGNPDTAMPRYAYGVASNKKFKADTERAHLMPGDSVYSNVIINPETGNSIADDAASYAMAGQLDRLDMNLNVGRMMKEAGRRKTNLLPGFLGGTNKYKCLPGFYDGDEDLLPPTSFAGRPGTFVNNTWNGTQYGGGFDALEGMPGLVISGRRTIDTMPRAKRPSNSQIDIMPGSRSSQSATGLVSQMGFGDAPLGVRAQGKNSIPDTMPVSSAVDRGSDVVSQMQIPGFEERVKGGARTTSSADGGAKKPGLFGKIKGVLGGLGGNIDLDNITTLGSAFINAAQRDARAAGGLRAPKSFVANPYEQDALQQLNSLHSDYYPVWAQNRELEGRGKSAIALSGGLSAGQRMLGYMGLTNQTQQNNASALFEHQGRENALRAQAAKASLEAGNQSATRQQQAYQWDEDMLAKAHAARENMLETSAYDRQNALTQYFKNAWEKKQFDRNMNLYESQQKNDDAKTQALINQLGANKTPVTLNGVADNAAMLLIDSNTGKFTKTNPFSASQLLSDDAKTSMDAGKQYLDKANLVYKNAVSTKKPKISTPTKRNAGKKGTKSSTKTSLKPTQILLPKGSVIGLPEPQKQYTFGYTGNPMHDEIQKRFGKKGK